MDRAGETVLTQLTVRLRLKCIGETIELAILRYYCAHRPDLNVLYVIQIMASSSLCDIKCTANSS